jgi:phosphomannomutase
MAPAARDAVVERLRAEPPEGWTADRPAPDVLVLRRGGGEGRGSIAASASERGADQAREPTIRHAGEGRGSIAARERTGPAREPTVERGERVVIRPSGTEPKLKAYLQVVEPVGDDLAMARAAADERLAALRSEIEALIGGPG